MNVQVGPPSDKIACSSGAVAGVLRNIIECFHTNSDPRGSEMNHLLVCTMTRPFVRMSINVAAAVLWVAFLATNATWAAQVQTSIVLTGVDRRPATSLNGEWGAIV